MLDNAHAIRDEELDNVFGGATIPEVIKSIKEYQNKLVPAVTAEEISAIKRITDSLCEQGSHGGIFLAIPLTKRLARDYPRLSPIIDIIPKG